MKVLLIRPPHDHMITTNVPKSVDTETGMYPPLGLLYVAASLKAWTDAQVELLDTPALHLDQKGIAERIARTQPDIVGIQAMTFTLIDAIATVRTAKSTYPSTHVCLGGPHVNLYPEETLSIEGVDSLVLGEGERPFADMVNALSRGTNIADVKGVAVMRNGKPITTEARALEENLDSLPQPARDLLDSSLYWSVLAKRNPVTTAMTSRGCPMKCIFCDRPHLGKIFRYRSAKSVVDEMEDCVNRGIQEIFLYDDTFTIRRERIFEIRDEIKHRGLDVQWDIRARANTLDAEVVKAMKEAGVARIHIGVESGSPRILKVMKKGISIEQAHNAFELCRKFGITSLSYFMLGNPTETREDIEMTMQFIRKCYADYAHISITTPFPGTELYRMGLEQGLFVRDYWRDFAANPDENFQPPAWTENFTQEQLEDMRQQAYRAFYGRPSRLGRQLLAVRSFKELWTKARVGVGLLFSK
ncbi:MAG: radical SAM protein [Planctomycetota bacterium]|nr:MAG: radical SAM protein [Planctomycetota bacterium]